MKKLSIFLMAAFAIVACSGSSNNASLNNDTDSLNYAYGVIIGTNTKTFVPDATSSDIAINHFLDIIQEAYEGLYPTDELSEIQKIGQQISIQIIAFEAVGIQELKAWVINEDIVFQAFVNSLYKKDVLMDGNQANSFFMSSYPVDMNASTEEKPVFAICPTEPQPIKLSSHLDSINCAFGSLLGEQVRKYIEDNTPQNEIESAFNELIGSINVIKSDLLNETAKQIGKGIAQQKMENRLYDVENCELEFDILRQGIIDALKGEEKFDSKDAIQYIQIVLNRRREAERKAQFEAVKVEGEAFLAENAKRPEVKTTESGLQYEIIVEGKGPKPTAEASVEVHYEGTLIDGTVFDSSYKRGESISFPLNGVIKGWTEGLQLMSVGSKYKLYIPYQLAYGENGAGASIPPYAALIFTVELLGIE